MLVVSFISSASSGFLNIFGREMNKAEHVMMMMITNPREGISSL
jgi:hypothetical protein